MCSDNLPGAVNQQERLDAYIAGFVDGEGCPFFEAQPLVSSKHQDFLTFALIVRRMEEGMHLSAEGFDRLRSEALSMNGIGRYRRVHVMERSESSETICRTPGSPGEEMVRPAWRHAEPGRNALAPTPSSGSGNNSVGPYPSQP